MRPFIPYSPAHLQNNERRKFISVLLKASVASAFAVSFTDAKAFYPAGQTKSYSVGDIMDLVIKAVPGAPFAETVDTLKSGSRETVVTGVITTMFATVNIINQAVKRGANFIIAHEPTFYNHTDDKNWVSNNHIVAEKQALLEKHNIAVWRLHDYLHSFIPDSVTYAVVKDAGWLAYYKNNEAVITIPEITLGKLAQQLKEKLRISRVRIIGNLSQQCRRIALLPGASGGQHHIGVVEKERPDVLIVGEVHEWETAEYIRDAQQLGEQTALLVLGHSVSEEPGLQWLQEWLQSKLPSLKVQHIVSGNPFTWV